MRNILFAAAIGAILASGVANAATIGSSGSETQQQSGPTYFHGGRSAPADFTDVNRYEAELQNQGLGAQQDNGGINQHAQQ
jgi:hypothetical protein